MHGKDFVLLALVICVLLTGQIRPANSQMGCVNPQMGSLKAAYGLHQNSCVVCEEPNTNKYITQCWADRFYTNAPGSRELCDSRTIDTHHCMAEVFINNAPDPPFSPQSKKMIHHNFPCPVMQEQDQCQYITGTAPFYHDKCFDFTLSPYPPISQKGMDTETDGIDTTMLFFHVGHGDERTCASWSTSANYLCMDCPNNSTNLKYMKLGNCKKDNMGMLRYFWQCSCDVFAHGPNKPQKLRDPDTGIEVEHANYPSPQDYQTPQGCQTPLDDDCDSTEMRSVFKRWGPVLGTGLRMACGVSTLAYCDGDAARSIWYYYRDEGKNFPVSDAFIMGLSKQKIKQWNILRWFIKWMLGLEVVPLCIASGGPYLGNSPLIKDQHFTNLPNEEPVPRTNLYIQYPQGFASQKIWPYILPPPPVLADIFRLKIPQPPPPIRGIEFKKMPAPNDEPHKMISTKPDADFGLSVRVNTVSGAVYFSGKQKFDPGPPKLSEAEYIDRAAKFIKHFGLTEESADAPRGIRMMLQSTSLESKGKTISHAQKNVIVTFKRHIIVDGTPVTVLGDGGEIQVQMNNDGSIINASKVWRKTDDTREKKLVPVKTYDEAYKEAVKSLKDPEAYDLERWTWGYKELSGSVKQEEMRIVYRFYFWPKKPGPPYSPVRMEIVGQN